MNLEETKKTGDDTKPNQQQKQQQLAPTSETSSSSVDLADSKDTVSSSAAASQSSPEVLNEELTRLRYQVESLKTELNEAKKLGELHEESVLKVRSDVAEQLKAATALKQKAEEQLLILQKELSEVRQALQQQKNDLENGKEILSISEAANATTLLQEQVKSLTQRLEEASTKELKLRKALVEATNPEHPESIEGKQILALKEQVLESNKIIETLTTEKAQGAEKILLLNQTISAFNLSTENLAQEITQLRTNSVTKGEFDELTKEKEDALTTIKTLGITLNSVRDELEESKRALIALEEEQTLPGLRAIMVAKRKQAEEAINNLKSRLSGKSTLTSNDIAITKIVEHLERALYLEFDPQTYFDCHKEEIKEQVNALRGIKSVFNTAANAVMAVIAALPVIGYAAMWLIGTSYEGNIQKNGSHHSHFIWGAAQKAEKDIHQFTDTLGVRMGG